MTDHTKPAIGLSVGATTLVAVTSDRSVTRKPVLTLPGLTVTDFVDRVGDPVGIVAPDGSVHAAEALLADALRALAYEATAGRPLPGAAAVTYPAHWRPRAVEALRRALGRLPEWSAGQPLLMPDAAAAATALQADPGLPTRGIVALCDFGGSGSSISLLDAAAGYRPIEAPLRHLDFSGDLIDQGVLAHVVAELSAGGTLDVTGTSAIGSLTRLRADCRAAKERLSTLSVTAVPADLPGFTGDVRLTRTELDDVVRRPLADVVSAVRDLLDRAGLRPADLVAVASVGGCAATPVITTTLSEHLRVPVVTAPRPALIPAIGAALRAARGPADDSPTALAAAPVLPVAPAVDLAPRTGAGLAWSQAPDVPDLELPTAEPAPVVRPQIDFDHDPADAVEVPQPWYRRPLPVVAAALLVIVMAGTAAGVALRNDSSAAAPAQPTPSVTTTPEAIPTVQAVAPPPTSAAPVPLQAPVEQPAPRTVVQVPAPVTQVVQAPPVTTEAPPPPPVTETSTTTVVTTTVSTPPPVTETATVTAPPAQTQPPPLIPTIPPIPTIPGLPQFFPQPKTSG
ncbi:Hsp70 family protein [Mycobacterium sp. DL592]|uniref:Hsp70 family protein n=1 Tax=Mycobacterium sp. DL592 TaxID=2675524 RepID=UPI0014242782|nr:Hsp70 family protein [Mycobacterium sp. DL592]